MRDAEGTGGKMRWVNGETREKESTVLGQPGEALLVASLLYSHAPMLILNKGPFLTWSENVSWGSCLTITGDVNLTCPVVWGIMPSSKLQRDPGHIVLSITSLLLSLMHRQCSLLPVPHPPTGGHPSLLSG